MSPEKIAKKCDCVWFRKQHWLVFTLHDSLAFACMFFILPNATTFFSTQSFVICFKTVYYTFLHISSPDICPLCSCLVAALCWCQRHSSTAGPLWLAHILHYRSSFTLGYVFPAPCQSSPRAHPFDRRVAWVPRLIPEWATAGAVLWTQSEQNGKTRLKSYDLCATRLDYLDIGVLPVNQC